MAKEYNLTQTAAQLQAILDNAPVALTVSGITSLTAAQLDALRTGDVVVKQTQNSLHAYVVAYKNATKGELSLVYCDHETIEEVYYEKTGGVWGYVITESVRPESRTNKVTSIGADSTDEQYPSAKCVHDYVSGHGSDTEAVEVAAAALCQHQKVLEHVRDGVLTGDSVKNNLTTIAARKPLSATQGKVLKDLSDENEQILGAALNTLYSVFALESAIAPLYSGSITYAVGDVRMYRNTLYKCKTAIATPEPFTASKWEVADLYTVLKDMINS